MHIKIPTEIKASAGKRELCIWGDFSGKKKN